MEHYILYVDDSGTKEYASASDLYSPKGNTRYFCFGGVLLSNQESAELDSKIKAHKDNCFGTEEIEIKSNWLRIPKERKRRYLDKFAISGQKLDSFVDNFYNIVSSANLTLMAVIVDKQHMQEDYGDRAWYPPALSYEILL